jgi:hypothetical protein
MEENNDLIESIEALLVKQTSDTKEIKQMKKASGQENLLDLDDLEEEEGQEFDHPNQDKFKIHIPTIDLSNEDDDSGSGLKSARSSATPDLNNESLTTKKIQFKIPFKREKISFLCELAVGNFYFERAETGQPLIIDQTTFDQTDLKNCDQLSEFFAFNSNDYSINNDETLNPNKSSDNNNTSENQEDSVQSVEFKFKRMLFDLIGELMTDLFIEKYQSPEVVSEFLPAVKRYSKKRYFKSVKSSEMSIENVSQLVKSKVMQLLKLDGQSDEFGSVESAGQKRQVTKSKWRSQKRLDLVDSLLDSEMREQEHEWANYEFEEYEAKLLISNTIFDVLLKDTIDCFQLNFLKKQSSSQNPPNVY